MTIYYIINFHYPVNSELIQEREEKFVSKFACCRAIWFGNLELNLLI